MKKLTIAVVAILLFAASQACHEARAYDNGDFQIWNTDVEDIKIYKNVKYSMEQEYRFGEDATELYYQHYDFGFVYGFDKRLDLGFFYRLVFERYKKKWREEDMPNVNATIKLDFWKFKFDDRNRIEFRHFRYQDDSIRYRNKFALRYPVDFKKMKISPYLSDEVFITSTGAGFNENRFCPGVEFELTKNAKADFYYMLKENRVRGSKWTWVNALGIRGKIAF